MEEEAKYESDVKLWISVADLHHKMFWLRQKELSQYDITVSQLYILVVIENLGAKATISTVAKALGRHVDVLSRCFLQVGIPHFCKIFSPAPVGKIKLT
jgi:hypothetical protein